MDIAALARFVDPSGKCSDPRMINAVAAYCGTAAAGEDDVARAHAMAKEHISKEIVPEPTMQAVQHLTGASVFVSRENGAVTGMAAFFLLRTEGMQAIERGEFDSVNIDLSLICRPRETPAGGYGWGFVGITDRGAGRAVKTSVAIRETLLWALPGYTRAATQAGARLIFGPFGFQRVAGDDTLGRSEARAAPLSGIIAEPRAA
jgi:hypothetical protein